ncbi:MAG TPA: SRPBCC family protein [Streptosporangiaceae bacterium]|nr:SRPBCC family protein [Streptosporangiaceae bacterium]
MPTAKRGHARIDIAAPPERVFGLTDVTRMGEWSPECYRCVWLDGATGAYVGARFRGYNKLGRYQWATTAVITAVEESRSFAFTVVHDKTGRDETAWRYRLASSPSRTVLTIRQTLRNVKAAAEAEPTGAQRRGHGRSRHAVGVGARGGEVPGSPRVLTIAGTLVRAGHLLIA